MDKNEVFSQRETEVVAHLLKGESNKQMASALGVSVSTVEFHLGNIYTKLGINSRAEAVLKLSESERRPLVEACLAAILLPMRHLSVCLPTA